VASAAARPLLFRLYRHLLPAAEALRPRPEPFYASSGRRAGMDQRRQPGGRQRREPPFADGLTTRSPPSSCSSCRASAGGDARAWRSAEARGRLVIHDSANSATQSELSDVLYGFSAPRAYYRGYLRDDLAALMECGFTVEDESALVSKVVTAKASNRSTAQGTLMACDSGPRVCGPSGHPLRALGGVRDRRAGAPGDCRRSSSTVRPDLSGCVQRATTARRQYHWCSTFSAGRTSRSSA
jgi:hypothetical protein